MSTDAEKYGWQETVKAHVEEMREHLALIDAVLEAEAEAETSVPPLPTEPGTVIAIGDWWLVRLRPYTPDVPAAWELLPGTAATRSSFERAGVKQQCVYGDEWVRAEADQHGGFEVLAEPIQAGSAVYTSEQLNAILNGARAGTAKAVRDRVREALPLGADRFSQDHLTLIAREFGATS